MPVNYPDEVEDRGVSADVRGHIVVRLKIQSLILDLLQFSEEMMARFMLLLMFVVIVVQKCCNNRVDRVLKSVSYVLTVRILFSFTIFVKSNFYYFVQPHGRTILTAN